MKYCPQCGKQNEDGVAFCGECGSAVDVLVNNKTSPTTNVNELGIRGLIKSKGFTTKKGLLFIAFGIICFFLVGALFQVIFFDLLNLYSLYKLVVIIAGSARIFGVLLFLFGIIVIVINEQKGSLVESDNIAQVNETNLQSEDLIDTKKLNLINYTKAEGFSNITNTKKYENMANQNRVVKVEFTGGLIGWFAQSQTNKLNNVISAKNKEGWEVVQLIEDKSSNLLIVLLRVVLLIITVFLFTFENGYKIILKRQKN